MSHQPNQDRATKDSVPPQPKEPTTVPTQPGSPGTTQTPPVEVPATTPGTPSTQQPVM